MPDEAFNWMGRIKAVEREYGVIRFGTDRLIVHVNDDPSILVGQVRRPYITPASAIGRTEVARRNDQNG